MFIIIVSFCVTVNGGPLQCTSFVQDNRSATLADCKVRRVNNVYGLAAITTAKHERLIWAKVSCEDVGMDG